MLCLPTAQGNKIFSSHTRYAEAVTSFHTDLLTVMSIVRSIHPTRNYSEVFYA